MSTPSPTPSINTESATFIGIDHHKKYSVFMCGSSASSGNASRLIDASGRFMLGVISQARRVISSRAAPQIIW